MTGSKENERRKKETTGEKHEKEERRGEERRGGEEERREFPELEIIDWLLGQQRLPLIGCWEEEPD